MTTIWTMGLEESPMRRMREGLKPAEFRLNKEKWRDIQTGNTIEFQLRDDQNETIVLDRLSVSVLEVVRRPTFRELLEYVYANGWGEQDRLLENQLASLERRYSEEERSKYPGVVGFHVNPMPQ
ncbi:MAG: hypothetical protein AAB649_02705 [Patescibacteria group bacterium]